MLAQHLWTRLAEFVNLNSGERTFVWADLARLRQVMINLLSNATKYRRNGRVAVSVLVADERTFIDVQDNGLGMSAEQLQHLYEPFNRLGRERQGIEGTGLGLALTRQLVQLMHGQIEVQSEVGIGTPSPTSSCSTCACPTWTGWPCSLPCNAMALSFRTEQWNNK